MSENKESVLIIGGSNGMGLASARLLADLGNQVIIAGRNDEKLAKAAGEIGGHVGQEVVDFSDEGSVIELFERVGDIDHLVLAASSAVAWGPFLELDTDAVRQAFDNKFWGFWHCLRHGLPKLRQSAVLLTGAAHRTAMPGTSALAAVNAAIAQMAMTLAKEVAPKRINVISPGLVATPTYDWMSPEQRDAFFQEQAARIPVGRVGRPEDIAHAVALLIGNGYMTGALIDVDGGAQLG